MLEDYLIIHKSILPDYYEKVLEVRRLMETGKVREISQAVKQVGISRSTYYKYKDYILEPAEMTDDRKAVFSMMLTHSPGVLSRVLSYISDMGGSVLTITQSVPIRNTASVTLTLDISAVGGNPDSLYAGFEKIPGVSNVRLIAVE